MKKHFFIFVVLLICYIQQSIAQENSLYLVMPGDRIEIKVLGQEDLAMTTLLDNTGKINYPFLGEIQVVGLSTKKIEKMIFEGLKGDYLVDPNVNVQVIEYRPFYISGEVNQPGSYPYQLGLTINQAVAIAGGLTERASSDKIYLIKEANKSKRIKVNFDETINAGDTITIEQRFF